MASAFCRSHVIPIAIHFQVVALVGESGGGKSTVASLLERFYDVTGGGVFVDGIDVRQLDPAWLRGKALGYINQEPVLFATSVKENIRYGKPDATDVQVKLLMVSLVGMHMWLPRGTASLLAYCTVCRQ